MYDKNTWQFWVFVLIAWALFPVTAAWLMLTHPGRCALITKRLLTGEMALFGNEHEIRVDAAKKVKAAFDGVSWDTNSFSYNGGPCLESKSGETKFYEAGEIDAAIKRLNQVLNELSA